MRDPNEERYHTTDITCPICATMDGLSYVEIPECSLSYVGADKGNYKQTFGGLRDYHCTNCDAEFLMLPYDEG